MTALEEVLNPRLHLLDRYPHSSPARHPLICPLPLLHHRPLPLPLLFPQVLPLYRHRVQKLGYLVYLATPKIVQRSRQGLNKRYLSNDQTCDVILLINLAAYQSQSNRLGTTQGSWPRLTTNGSQDQIIKLLKICMLTISTSMIFGA